MNEMTRRQALKLAAASGAIATGVALGASADAADDKPKDDKSKLEVVAPDLYASAPEPLHPFAPALDLRAFLLRRKQGNLLVYGSAAFDAQAPAVRDLGGVAHWYLNHWHEALFAAGGVGAPLYCHEVERELVAKKTRFASDRLLEERQVPLAVGETFSKRHMVGDDFEVIPTPGHTPGSTAFLWKSGRYRFLFTSDQIYVKEGEWVAAVLPASVTERFKEIKPSDRDAYIKSLELIREIEFDVLVPWVAPRGKPYVALTDKTDAQRRIDAILKRVRSGENY
jgi:hypothetical protein